MVKQRQAIVSLAWGDSIIQPRGSLSAACERWGKVICSFLLPLVRFGRKLLAGPHRGVAY
jgi:hypothetical protein